LAFGIKLHTDFILIRKITYYKQIISTKTSP